jgi:predicted TIM-barrel fold metal-dependent hydrolase
MAAWTGFWPLLLLLASPATARAQDRPPIIDMHLHALAADDQGPPPVGLCTPFPEFRSWDQRTPLGEQFLTLLKSPPCDDPVWSPATNEALMRETIAVMDRLNIVGVLSGPPERVTAWRSAAPHRFLPGPNFRLQPEYPPERVRALHRAGNLAVLAEVTTQYAGIAPDDPRLEPYWALAEELDIPVGIHVGTGPPGMIYLGESGYRARLHSALTMEEVLVRHPRLRVYLMHAGYPMIDDLLTVLYAHPQVHVEVGVIVFTQPRAAFYRYLERIVEAGFANRILFGSDQMVWPEAIERSVRVIEQAPFLTSTQKRDILYNNAARFLRLTEEQIEAHRRTGRRTD